MVARYVDVSMVSCGENDCHGQGRSFTSRTHLSPSITKPRYNQIWKGLQDETVTFSSLLPSSVEFPATWQQGEARRAPLQTPLCLHHITHAFDNPSPTHEPDASIPLARRPFASYVLAGAPRPARLYKEALTFACHSSTTTLPTSLPSFK
jgi:hypothetical protein